MTNVDKKEISNILNGVREMKKCADDSNRVYIDEKVRSFAMEAKKDFLDNRMYMVDIINENISLFFDLDNLKVSTSGACCDGYQARRGEKFTYSIGNGVSVTLILEDFDILKNTGYDITFRVRKMTACDISFYTSDTRDERYRTCSAWGLEKYREYDDLSVKRTAKDWHTIYCASTWTRAKNVLLVKEFKTALNMIMDEYRSVANSNNEVKDSIKTNVGVYKKVNLG